MWPPAVDARAHLPRPEAAEHPDHERPAQANERQQQQRHDDAAAAALRERVARHVGGAEDEALAHERARRADRWNIRWNIRWERSMEGSMEGSMERSMGTLDGNVRWNLAREERIGQIDGTL